MPDRDQLVLAGLLYDMGAFRHRAFGDGENYRELGADWLLTKAFPGATEIGALIGGGPFKHENAFARNQVRILAEADRLCYCSEQRAASPDLGSASPVLYPLSASTSPEKKTQTPVGSSWPICPLEPGRTYPHPTSSGVALQSQYADLWQSFESELDLLLPGGLSADRLLVLLEKHCTCMPPAMGVGSEESPATVSLFDYAKLRAALACCQHNYFLAADEQRYASQDIGHQIEDREAALYRLVLGELSGIRQFVYRVGQSNDLAVLQARSFFVELAVKHLADEIVHRLGLSRANVVFAGDGRFCILAQNTQGARMRLAKIQRTFNDWLLDVLDGGMHLALGHIEVRGCDLTPAGLSEVWRDAAEALQQPKRQWFVNALEHVLAPRESLLKEDGCSMCGTDHFDTDLRNGLCTFCYGLLRATQMLPEASLVARSPSGLDGLYQIKLPRSDGSAFYYAVLKDETLVRQINPDQVYRINDWNLEHYRLEGSSQWLMNLWAPEAAAPTDATAAGATPQELRIGRIRAAQQQVPTMEDLAESSCGRNEIGVLEMRLDDLRPGKAGQAEHATLLGAFSVHRQAGLFFKAYADLICQGNMPDHISPFRVSPRPPNTPRSLATLHSSSSLVAVGAWDDIVEAAFDLRACFQAFVGSATTPGVSAAVVVAPPDYPTYRMLEMTRQALLESSAKNAITLFYDGGRARSPARRAVQSRQVYVWEEARDSVAGLVKDVVTMCSVTAEEGRTSCERVGWLARGLSSTLAEWEQAGAYHLPNLAHSLARVREVLRRQGSADPGLWQKISGSLLDTSRIGDLRTIVVWLSLLAGTADHQAGET